MDKKHRECPDCSEEEGRGNRPYDRRQFLTAAAGVAAAAAAGGVPLFAVAKASAAPTPQQPAGTAVKGLFDMLTDDQKKVVCFKLGLPEQGQRPAPRARLQQLADHQAEHPQRLLHQEAAGRHPRHLEGHDRPRLVRPSSSSSSRTTPAAQEWGERQDIAIFGKPGEGKFEFVPHRPAHDDPADGNTTRT